MFSSTYLRALEIERKEPDTYVNNLKGHQCRLGGWARENVWSLREKFECGVCSNA